MEGTRPRAGRFAAAGAAVITAEASASQRMYSSSSALYVTLSESGTSPIFCAA